MKLVKLNKILLLLVTIIVKLLLKHSEIDVDLKYAGKTAIEWAKPK